MRIVYCTQDGVTYQAEDFNQAEDFINKKRFLECPECHGPAFYRGLTRNGREACFGARPHAPGCDLASVEHDGDATGQGDVEDEIFTTGQRIIVDFNQGTTETDSEALPVGVQADTGNARVRNGQGPTVREIMYRRMSSLLRTLIHSEEFRRSTQVIEIAEQGEFAVTDFFVNFAEVTGEHLDSYHGFWGMIPDARIDGNGTLWFNSGRREDMSVLLDRAFIETIYQRFRIEDVEDIAGAYILVLGVLREAANGKKYVLITDPAHFTLRLA